MKHDWLVYIQLAIIMFLGIAILGKEIETWTYQNAMIEGFTSYQSALDEPHKLRHELEICDIRS